MQDRTTHLFLFYVFRHWNNKKKKKLAAEADIAFNIKCLTMLFIINSVQVLFTGLLSTSLMYVPKHIVSEIQLQYLMVGR